MEYSQSTAIGQKLNFNYFLFHIPLSQCVCSHSRKMNSETMGIGDCDLDLVSSTTSGRISYNLYFDCNMCSMSLVIQ